MAVMTGTTPATEQAPGESGRRRTRLLLAVLVLLVLAGGGLAAKPMLLGSQRTAGPVRPEPGPILRLDPMTLNLSDGHFLKLGLALQLTKKAGGAAGSTVPADSSPVSGAPAQDAAILVLGERTYAQLLAPGGRARALAALQREVDKRYASKVLQVYFTEFVMQ